MRGEVEEAMAKGGQNAQRGQGWLGVVAQELGIAEEEAGLGVVVGVPGGQRQTQPESHADSRQAGRAAAGARKLSNRLTAARVSGMAIGRLLQSAAAENQSAAAQGLRSRCGQRVDQPHSVQAAAKMSAWASELCANQMG